jgi:uncharacterized protein (TIGR02266 family)
MSDGSERPSEVRCAREGRALLGEALEALGGLETEAALVGALERIQGATRVLFELETEPPTSNAHIRVRATVGQLSQALDILQRAPHSNEGNVALEAVARALAVLYPLARAHQRQRRRVVMEGLEPPESLPLVARAPEPRGQAPERQPFSGAEKRARGERIFLEVDIGLYSESRFFAGLSQDLSDGGIFVATFQPRPPGTRVALHFVLPGGRAVLVKGVVRWSNTVAGRLPPGMGVAFEDLSGDDLAAIRAFCDEHAALLSRPGER